MCLKSHHVRRAKPSSSPTELWQHFLAKFETAFQVIYYNANFIWIESFAIGLQAKTLHDGNKMLCWGGFGGLV